MALSSKSQVCTSCGLSMRGIRGWTELVEELACVVTVSYTHLAILAPAEKSRKKYSCGPFPSAGSLRSRLPFFLIQFQIILYLCIQILNRIVHGIPCCNICSIGTGIRPGTDYYGIESGIYPVSYTHLDVYKRQAPPWARFHA